MLNRLYSILALVGTEYLMASNVWLDGHCDFFSKAERKLMNRIKFMILLVESLCDTYLKMAKSRAKVGALCLILRYSWPEPECGSDA